VPRILLQQLRNLLEVDSFEEVGVMGYRDTTRIEGSPFELIEASLDFYLVAHHVRSKKLALVGTDLAFGT